jgi:transposase, IS5 family
VFRSVSDGATLWEVVLPAEAVRLPKDIAAADRVLADPGLVEVFRRYFSPDQGRRSIPLDTFVRLMFLKWHFGVGYDQLVEWVEGSITLRVFARIGIDQPVPDPSTLKRIAKRCGVEAVEALNQVLVVGAGRRGLVDVSRVRVDSTIVDANLAYPTDSGLLTKAVKGLVAAGERLSSPLGLGVRVDDVGDELADLNREIGAWARSRHPDRADEILVVTDQIADLARRVGSQALTVVEAAAPLLATKDRAPKGTRRALNTMRALLGVLDDLVFQATERARERPVPAAQKRLSLHDTDARPMSKGTTRKGTQFGYTAQIAEDANGLIIDYGVHIGQPGDSDLIGPAIQSITAALSVPQVVTADKTYGAAHAREALTEAGVGLVAIVAKGNQSPERQTVEATDTFKAHTRWRAGIEARISTLKRDHGWDRTRMSGITGARTWLGWGIFSHNTLKEARLL